MHCEWYISDTLWSHTTEVRQTWEPLTPLPTFFFSQVDFQREESFQLFIPKQITKVGIVLADCVIGINPYFKSLLQQCCYLLSQMILSYRGMSLNIMKACLVRVILNIIHYQRKVSQILGTWNNKSINTKYLQRKKRYQNAMKVFIGRPISAWGCGWDIKIYI